MCKYLFVNIYIYICTHIHSYIRIYIHSPLMLKMQKKWDLSIVICQLDGNYIHYTETTTLDTDYTWRKMAPKQMSTCTLCRFQRSHIMLFVGGVSSEILSHCFCRKQTDICPKAFKYDTNVNFFNF